MTEARSFQQREIEVKGARVRYLVAGSGPPVVDLMEALRRSVAEAQGRAPSAGTKKTKAATKGGSRSRRAPARKSA